MTVRVHIELGVQGTPWTYDYFEREDFLHARRATTKAPVRTLQGALELIVKQDRDGTIAVVDALIEAGPSHWRVVGDLQVPPAEPGQIYATEDIIDDHTQVYLTNPDYSICCAHLIPTQPQDELRHVAIAQQVVIGVAQDCTLASIWLLGLPSGIALGKRTARAQSVPQIAVRVLRKTNKLCAFWDRVVSGGCERQGLAALPPLHRPRLRRFARHRSLTIARRT